MQTNIVHASRVFMGDSLGFHIIFLVFGLTLPILVLWFEYLGYKRKEKRLTEVAKLWSKIMTILIIAGVMSGTIIALQMSLVWPGILKFGGQVIGLPFIFETYAFILEAVFIALYMLTWNSKKVSTPLHMLFGFFIIVGGTMSAYSITSVNAFMNLPTGFSIIKGKMSNIDVWQAMFSRTSIIEFIHSMLGYYLAVAMIIAGIYAFKLLKQNKAERAKKDNLSKYIITKLVLFSGVIILLSIITGDINGKYLTKYEPVKLAQMEAVTKTTTNAPLILGGIVNNDGKLVGPYFKIPNALSILAGNSPKTEIKGIDIVPASKRPPAYIHIIYDVKLLMVGILSAAIICYLAAAYLRPKLTNNKFLLGLFASISIFGIIIVELGWMLTEIGRQPWAVNGYVTTEQALTKTNNITSFGYIFPTLFIILFGVTIYAVNRVIKENQVED